MACVFTFAAPEAAPVELTAAEQAYLKDKGAITMCVDPDWMPYERIDENGEHIGIAADYFTLFTKFLGVPFSILQTVTWNESVALAKARKCDIMSMLNESKERKEYLNFTRPYLNADVVIVARDDVVYINGLDAMRGLSLAVVKGYIFEEIIRERYPDIALVTTSSLKESLRLISDGQVHATISSLYIAARHIQEVGLTNLKVAGQTDFKHVLRVGVRNDDPMLLAILDKAVASVQPAEEAELLQRWFTVRVEHGVDYTILWQVLVGALALVSFLLYRTYTTRHFNLQLEAANVQLQKKNQTLEKVSETDHLTGVFNRIHLDKALQREITRCARYGHPLSVIMIDIDNFKLINDRHGHPVGDMALIRIAELLNSRIRTSDTFGRWGGEEFLLVCPETDRDGAITQAENLRGLVAADTSHGLGTITASFGVAQLQPGELERTLIGRADAALYQAKDDGRNCVRAAG